MGRGGVASLLNKVKRLERSVRPGVAAANETTWREWLALCAAPCLDAAGRLAARVNAAVTAEPAAEAPHPCALPSAEIP